MKVQYLYWLFIIRLMIRKILIKKVTNLVILFIDNTRIILFNNITSTTIISFNINNQSIY
jgi:hypothetical protein